MKIKLLLGIVFAALVTLAGCQSTPHEMADDMGDMDTMDESMDDMDESTDDMDDMDTMDEPMDDMAMMDTEFLVTIEVLGGSPTPLAPVAWAVHEGPNPFVAGDMGKLAGLEALAEDGDPSAVAATLGGLMGVAAHGVANTPDGAMGPGPATPGTSYSFTVKAHDGQRLSFATMYVQSNDLFFSPGPDGIALFDMEMAAHGTVTQSVWLYDAGTEKNERPGSGPNQAPRQSGPNTGMSENKPVAAIADAMDGFSYPAVASVIRVTIGTPGSM